MFNVYKNGKSSLHSHKSRPTLLGISGEVRRKVMSLNLSGNKIGVNYNSNKPDEGVCYKPNDLYFNVVIVFFVYLCSVQQFMAVR